MYFVWYLGELARAHKITQAFNTCFYAESQKYFYITNRLTMKEDYQAIYPPTTTTRSDYVTKTIDGELIDINKLEMNEMNSTKSIVSKRGDRKY